MCGIVGIVSSTNCDRISNCKQMISHRGPDDDGIFSEGFLAFGHQRLSIIDLSNSGHQPMFSNDANLVIIFNGEIYNFPEIRRELSRHYKFKSTSDTEAILAGYELYGTDIFKKLNGIFAIAIYVRSEKKLILARDPFGVKPLYYYSKNNELYFSSEIKSFLRIPGWDKSIDYQGILSYLHFLYSPGVKTPFQHVLKFPAGHFAVIDIEKSGKIEFSEYYHVLFDGTFVQENEQEAIDRVDIALNLAVKRQLLADVPVGFFLSGGIDSSLIVAKAKELTGIKYDCFTIKTDFQKDDIEGFTDDLTFARFAAKKIGVRLNEIDGRIDVLSEFDKMIWHLDEPQADAAPLHILNIGKSARQMGYKVLLGGTGGDDIFSGYRRHQALNYEFYFRLIPKVFLTLSRKISSYISINNPRLRRVVKILKYADSSEIDRLAGYFEWLPYKNNLALLSKEVQERIQNFHPKHILLKSLDEIKDEKNSLNKMLFWELKFFLTDHNLNYTDKLSMGTGVEVRVPYLDQDLVELSTKLNPKYKLKGYETKYILKRIALKYFPDTFVNRPKTGFGAPIRKWITKDLDEMIYSYLSPSNISERGIFDPRAVWELINRNKSGRVDASYSIWCLLAIESWMRQFVDDYK